MTDLTRVTSATLDVLEVLLDHDDGELYGRRIARQTGLATGSTFPILARLERLGWASSRWEDADPASTGARRRFYRLTPEGTAGAQAVLARRRNRTAPASAAQPALDGA
jgi:DNA-binding PadR family transcriptional regulator